MKRILLLIPVLLTLIMPVSALELDAPMVPKSGAEWMPRDTTSFGAGLIELAENVILLRPELKEAAGTCLSITAVAMLLSILKLLPGKRNWTADLAGVAVVSVILLKNCNALIIQAAETIQELSNYAKLFFPVMAAAMAAQGGATASVALYAGTTVFDSLLGSMMSGILVPAVYLFLSIAVGYAATGEGLLKRLRDFIKNAVSWSLKTLLTVFTTYMSITGVVSGTTDAAALKATKVTISSVVPVVGGILSDASEAVLVSAGLMKNAAGVYGILAVLAVFLEPFVHISVQYLILKTAAALCGIFGEGSITTLTEDFSSAMGLLLAMTGSVCLLLLISTVCFMKGVG